MRFVLGLVATNLKAALALRTTFAMQVGFMLLNNLLFFVFWWVMFQRFEHIRGWRIDDVAVLFGVSAAGYGVAVVIAGGVRDMARRISEGELDPMLTLPRSVLVQAAAARMNSTGWGDIVTGLVLVMLSEHGSVERLPVLLLAILVSACVFTASGVLIHCTAFWLGRVDSIARQATEFIITFSVYPPVLFGGAIKVLLFTVLPPGSSATCPCSWSASSTGPPWGWPWAARRCTAPWRAGCSIGGCGSTPAAAASAFGADRRVPAHPRGPQCPSEARLQLIS